MRRVRSVGIGGFPGTVFRRVLGVLRGSLRGTWRIWRFPDQVIRLSILLVVGVAAMISLRERFIPDTFGEEGHYRAMARTLVGSQMIRYAGWQECVDCHEGEGRAKFRSYHSSLSCEVCHGPLRTHVKDDEVVAPMPVDQSSDLCARCHQYLVARPKTFPQVVFRDHVTERGGESGETQCVECHDAHNSSE